MRLIHTSDWHLGRTLHGETLLDHQAAFLEWLLAESVRHGADAVVVAGDVYDRAVPSTDAVTILDRALHGFARARIPVLMTSGNHDSAVRLGFGARLSELAGIHLRTCVPDIARPVILRDSFGEVALYGIPYLLPDAVMTELGAERSHTSVLAAAAALIREDAAARGIGRVVVAAHAFVTGGEVSDSERDIRVGGIGDAPASVFAGFTYVALGHLHGAQQIAPGATLTASTPLTGGTDLAIATDLAGATDLVARTVIRYCGSPLAFSFSERRHVKSVTLTEIDGTGQVVTTALAAPVPRPLREVRGRLAELLSRADGDLAELADSWVKAVLTDTVRPAAPMERLREKWPHTIALDFAPDGGLAAADADLGRLAQTADPVEICAMFVGFASGGEPDEPQRAILRDAVEAAQHAAAGA
jgi:exonuclease SbcD